MPLIPIKILWAANVWKEKTAATNPTRRASIGLLVDLARRTEIDTPIIRENRHDITERPILSPSVIK
jgi:hypothetical protein